MDLANLYDDMESLKGSMEDLYDDVGDRLSDVEKKVCMLWKVIPKEYVIINKLKNEPIKIFVNKVMAETWLNEQYTKDQKSFRKKSELAKEDPYYIKIVEVPRGYYTNVSVI